MVKLFKIIEKIVWVIAALAIVLVVIMIVYGIIANTQQGWQKVIPYLYLAAFLFAMRAPNGRMGLWELAAALTGFLLWEHVLCRFKQRLTAFFAQIRAKKEAAGTKFRQKNTSKN